MSVGIDPERIGERLRDRDHLYVLSVRDGRVHAVSHRGVVNGADVTIATASDSLRARLADDERVTLLWPPARTQVAEYDDYSLVADGNARVTATSVIVTVSSAVLHRPAI